MPTKKTAKTTMRTSHKKDLDAMTEAHRAKIERWEPMLPAIGAQHIWASSPRFRGRGDGAFYLAVKVGPRNYGIVSYDTSTPAAKAKVLVSKVESPKDILEQFGAYRLKAKAERGGVTTKATKTTKASAKKTVKAPAKTVAKPKTKVIVRKTAKAS